MEFYLKPDVFRYAEAGQKAEDYYSFLRLVANSASMPCPGVLVTMKGCFTKERIFQILNERAFYNYAMEGYLSYIGTDGGMVVYVNEICKYVYFPRKMKSFHEGIFILRRELGWMSTDAVLGVLRAVWGDAIPIVTQKEKISENQIEQKIQFLGGQNAALVRQYLDRFKTSRMIQDKAAMSPAKIDRLLSELIDMYINKEIIYKGKNYPVDEGGFLEALSKVANKQDLIGLRNQNYFKVVALNGRLSNKAVGAEGY